MYLCYNIFKEAHGMTIKLEYQTICVKNLNLDKLLGDSRFSHVYFRLHIHL
jgi:hypothetical protein